ncbi:Oidioi.mRNA.OKI2018_I69.chr2.g4677.t1.cds [Oikopleura dioica]|uniref:Oidioi.mRNA.OKI2018_I69.chr2.g4677.t1.cds n=1 Tax=Oikopleura dioica TaxID=34765 RepID=A0ABN7T774_OIKDI|nr:Oidioi.mRNA.OKI2018_I69.chr2.g4677.t1.cds [Oikopleura dioica]
MNTLVKRPTFRISDAFVPDENADIVLIRLAMSIDFKKTNSGVVCLPPDGHREHQEQHFYKVNCYSAGFGFLGMNPITPAKYLQEAPFPVTSCKIYSTIIKDDISNLNLLCSRQDKDGSHALCRGDSGGPLLCITDISPMLVGVARTSTGCERQRFFGHSTFTNVVFWNHWIRETIKDREDSIVCFEPFRMAKITKHALEFLELRDVNANRLMRLNVNKGSVEESVVYCKNQCERSAGCVQFLVLGTKICFIILPSVTETGKFRSALSSVNVKQGLEMWHGRIQRTNSDGKSSECGVKKYTMEYLNTYDTNWGAFRRIFVKQYSITYRYRVNQLENKSTEIEIDMYTLYRKSGAEPNFDYLTERTNSELANFIVNKIDLPSATDIGVYLSRVLSSYIMTINFEESMSVFGVNTPVQCNNMFSTCNCADGYVHIDNLCVDINQCAKFTSLCGGSECINTPGSYHCRNTEIFQRRATSLENHQFHKDTRIWRLYEKRLLNGRGRCISRDRPANQTFFEKLMNINDSVKLLKAMKDKIDKIYKFCSAKKRKNVNYSFEKAFSKLIKR